MEDSERAYAERVRNTSVMNMSLETLFPDERVRMLADAAGKGQLSRVEELVSQGVDVNAKGTQNAPPLFWAFRNYAGFHKLLELGANPNVVIQTTSILGLAIQHRDIRFMEDVLAHGGDPNIRYGSGLLIGTAIHYVLMPELTDRLLLLLKSGADINAQRNNGATPVMDAVRRGEFDVAYWLLEKGADYRIKALGGKTLIDDLAISKRVILPNSDRGRAMQRVIEWLERRGRGLANAVLPWPRRTILMPLMG